MTRERGTPNAPYWNGWWTLTVITAAATIVVAVLEALGVFRDLGIALSIVGIILSVLFGVTASTRSAVGTVTTGVAALRDELGTVRDEVTAVRSGLGSVPDEIGTVRDEIGAVRVAVGAVREEITSLRMPLERILQTLVERLPPAPSR